MKKTIIILGLAVIGAGLYFWLGGQGASQAQQGQPGGMGGRPPTEVSVITLQPEQIDITKEFPGRTSAYKMAEIRPQVSGIITNRLFKEGSKVEKGQQLYQIDPAPYEAAYKMAEAEVQSATANVKSIESRADRYAELVKIDAVSRQEYDDIRASLDQAKAAVAVADAALAVAKVDLDYTKVYAPIAGQISKSNVTAGALVTAGQSKALASITQLDPIYADLTVPVDELTRIRHNLSTETPIPVWLYLEATGGKYAHKGLLQFSEVTVNETTGSVQLRALFPNPDHILLPGMFVRARIGLGTKQVLLVPQQAAIRGADGGLSVWKLNADNTVQPVPVTASQESGSAWIITEGVKAGDRIVTAGFQKIQPGATVTPVPAQSSETPPASPEAMEE